MADSTFVPLTNLIANVQSYTGVCFDSRKLSPNCIFVAVRGAKSDGHDHLPEAAKAQASALVVENPTTIPSGYPGAVVKVGSSRKALNQLASAYYGHPAAKFFNVGVTGTNGKTTTTYLVEALLNRRGWPAGVIGTIDHHLVNQTRFVWKTEMTTPDPVSFQARLAEFKEHGARALAMEVSSHALDQSRADEVPFDVAIFTNLTRDHLDYHKDMEAYFQAKRRLFTDLLANSAHVTRRAIINRDDEYGRRLLGDVKNAWSYGVGSADLGFEIKEQGFGGSRFDLRTPHGTAEIAIRMPGPHNVYNATAAIGAALAAGLDLDAIRETLASFKGVPGRLEAVPNKAGLHVFVDYAHTDDALRSILRALNEIRRNSKEKNRIITVFGCGGDRDKGKRPLMMRAAQGGSDAVVLTSDNPRTEDPARILEDAAVAADPNSELYKDVDRKKGIAKAIEIARPGDVVLIAGKGHEDYQILGTQKFPFSDVEVVKGLIG